MEHEQIMAWLPAYLDQELSLGETLEFERHLETCAACQAVCAQQRAVSTQLRQSTLQWDAPPGLAQRIAAALPTAPHQALHQAPQQALRQRLRRWSEARWLNWAGAGSLAVSVALFGWSASLYLALPSAEQRLSHELVDDHIRSLQAEHLSDVISTDRHTVKPWFNGRLDFAPPVIDLAQQGYPLVGGRLDFIGGRAVAVLVYRYQLHPINLYIWPGDTTGSGLEALTLQGYRLAHWRAAGMNYWAVTDAGPSELDAFVALLRAGPHS